MFWDLTWEWKELTLQTHHWKRQNGEKCDLRSDEEDIFRHDCRCLMHQTQSEREKEEKAKGEHKTVCNKLNNKWALTIRKEHNHIESEIQCWRNLSLYSLSPPDNIVAFLVSAPLAFAIPVNSLEIRRCVRSEMKESTEWRMKKNAKTAIWMRVLLVASQTLLVRPAASAGKKTKKHSATIAHTEIKWKECNCSNRQDYENNNG